MTFEQVVALIERLGFPAAVAGFVLFRVDPALRALTAALAELRVELARHREGACGPPPH
jgi:hypothetical protein